MQSDNMIIKNETKSNQIAELIFKGDKIYS